MAADQGDPLIGTVLARRFEIVAPIGAGGMGRIYRAVQRPLDRLVALKVLNPRFDGANDPKFEERFFLEALMTAKLKHPNTVTIYDYGRSEEGIYFMALELLEGETLQQALVKGGAMEWSRALLIAAQVARSLREAHQLGLVHRDLKPANIMLLSEGRLGDRVKVLDFGLVKNVISFAAASVQEDQGLTEAGVVLGSPLYMAPEQARKAIDVRSDVYSLGAVMFATMAGRTPFLGKKPFDLMVKHMHEKPPELTNFARVPASVNALVMKCLAKAPEHRFQDADELLMAIDHALCSQGRGGLLLTRAASVVNPRDVRVITEELVAPKPVPSVVVEGPKSKDIRVAPRAPVAHRAPVAPRASAAPPAGRARGRHSGRRPWSRLVLWGIVLGVGSSALGAVLVASHGERRAQAPAPSRSVVFDVSSEPSGATVLRDKEPVGVTPLQVTVPKDGQEPPRTKLALVLDGYETAVVAAEGRDRLVPVHQVLARRVDKPTPKMPVPRLKPVVPPPSAASAKPPPPKKTAILAPLQYRSDPYE